jgi:inositol transport system substrate-binding protein
MENHGGNGFAFCQAKQGKGALDAALKLAKGEAVEQKTYIPFQLVTPSNIDKFVKKN